MSGAEPITEYPELTTPAADDELYIVDKNDVTEGAEGTSKRISVENLSIAARAPSAYMYHDATTSLNTPLVINVPSELDIDAVFTGNLFTNAGDGLITSSSTRAFKAYVSYSLCNRISSGSANVRLSIRKNSIATNAGEFVLMESLLSAHRNAGISREVDFSLGDNIALWVENISNSNDAALFSLTTTINFIGWI